MFKALILIDNDVVNYSIDLIEVVNRLSGSNEVSIYGLGINLDTEGIKGFDSILQVNDPAIQQKDSRVLTDIMEQVHKKYQFDAIIILATDFGRMLAPRLAMRLQVGLVADITDIEVDGEERKLIRPAFSGNMLASIVCDTSPIMASVHPNVFHLEKPLKEPEKVTFPIEVVEASTIDILSITKEKKVVDIREADVLISAGAGYQSTIDELEEVAELLGGNIAVSKPVVEKNLAPREIQVGQSGKTVSPSLYIALGIYGSMQHVEGLKNVTDIISVNIDEGAPMNYLATVVLIGDAVEFIEKLTRKLHKKNREIVD